MTGLIGRLFHEFAVTLSAAILVSGVINDLAAGSGLRFAEHGSETIEGCEGPVRTFALVTEEHLQPSARTPKTAGLDVLSANARCWNWWPRE